MKRREIGGIDVPRLGQQGRGDLARPRLDFVWRKLSSLDQLLKSQRSGHFPVLVTTGPRIDQSTHQSGNVLPLVSGASQISAIPTR